MKTKDIGIFLRCRINNIFLSAFSDSETGLVEDFLVLKLNIQFDIVQKFDIPDETHN